MSTMPHIVASSVRRKKKTEKFQVKTWNFSVPFFIRMMAAAPATEFSVSLSKRLIKYSTHGLSVFLLGHGQPFCTLPGIQGSGEKKVNYELATPLTDTLKKGRDLAWWLKLGFLYKTSDHCFLMTYEEWKKERQHLLGKNLLLEMMP